MTGTEHQILRTQVIFHGITRVNYLLFLTGEPAPFLKKYSCPFHTLIVLILFVGLLFVKLLAKYSILLFVTTVYPQM